MTAKVLCVAQQKGGAGKTTLAAALGMALRAEGARVAFLDIDPQGSLGRWFMTRFETKGPEDGLSFATASAWGTSYEVDKLKRDHDYVLIDTPPKVDSDLRPALRAADLVIVPITVSQLDLWATESVLEMAAREEKDAILVMNRAAPRAKLTAEVRQKLGQMPVPVVDTVLGNRVAHAEVLGTGGTVMDKPKIPAALEIAALRDEVRARLG